MSSSVKARKICPKFAIVLIFEYLKLIKQRLFIRKYL
jgi:hypothetical protein